MSYRNANYNCNNNSQPQNYQKFPHSTTATSRSGYSNNSYEQQQYHANFQQQQYLQQAELVYNQQKL